MGKKIGLIKFLSAGVCLLFLSLAPQWGQCVTVDDMIVKVDDYYSSGEVRDASTYTALSQLLQEAKGSTSPEKEEFKEAFTLLVQTMAGSSISQGAADQLLLMINGL